MSKCYFKIILSEKGYIKKATKGIISNTDIRKGKSQRQR